MSVNTLAQTDDQYIVFGIDFKDFLGTGIDLSGIIDTLGGAFNFEISSGLSCLFCIFSIIILIFFVEKGGGKNDKQPLVIEMPMMSKPYPFNDSPFPRDT